MSKGTDPKTYMHEGPTKQPDTWTGGRADARTVTMRGVSEKPGGDAPAMTSANSDMKKRPGK